MMRFRGLPNCSGSWNKRSPAKPKRRSNRLKNRLRRLKLERLPSQRGRLARLPAVDGHSGPRPLASRDRADSRGRRATLALENIVGQREKRILADPYCRRQYRSPARKRFGSAKRWRGVGGGLERHAAIRRRACKTPSRI